MREHVEPRASEAFVGGTGSPLLLLHGLTMSWCAWKPVVPYLVDTHHVFAPTLAGHHGGPPLSRTAIGPAPLLDAVERQMDAMGWDTAHLVGNSLGGWLALALAERGRARTVVAFSPAGACRDRRAYVRLARLLRAMQTGSRYGAVDRLVAHRATRGIVLGRAINRHRDLSADEVAGMLLDIRACRLTDGLLAWMDHHGPLPPFDIPADVPLRIAWPLKDRLTPWREYGRPFHALIPRAERVHLDDVGHVPMYDDPRLVADTILRHTGRFAPRAG